MTQRSIQCSTIPGCILNCYMLTEIFNNIVFESGPGPLEPDPPGPGLILPWT